MNNERRKYPRVDLGGEASILLSGVIRNGTLMNLSPSGIQIECSNKLIEQLSKSKSPAGLYPDFELEFALPPEDDQAVVAAEPSNSNKNSKKSRAKKSKSNKGESNKDEPNDEQSGKTIKSTCNVSYCRRLRQDSYHLGLNFISLTEQDEKKLSEYISHSDAA